MDRKIEKKKTSLPKWLAIVVVAGTGLWFASQFLSDAAIRTYRVPAEQLLISRVEYGAFEDLIPIRGTIQPSNSVFLDAVAGGVIEEVFVEEGSFVEKGQPLLQLSNTDLRLNVAQNDTRITEQINNLSNIANDLETRKLNTERSIIDTEYRITVLERLKTRSEKLVDDRLVSKEEFDAIVDELAYQQKILANTRSRQEIEERIRMDRTIQIASQMEKLEENLEVSLDSFENLLVRAPISGQLTSLPVDIGENKTRGQRLGQIDVVDQFKIVAQVDEYYVNRVSTGQDAQFLLQGVETRAIVDKVYPEISSGTFEVDLLFAGLTPANIRRGQTLQIELILGNPTEAMLLPLGGFIQDTGGNWVFVLSPDGSQATRRDIRVGRRNNRYVEVLEGLDQGDRVITSSYNQMEDMERVELTGT